MDGTFFDGQLGCRSTDRFVYNGVDRVNNGFGYEEGNAVPCCRTCNVAKRDMAVEDFLAWIKRAYLHQTENRP